MSLELPGAVQDLSLPGTNGDKTRSIDVVRVICDFQNEGSKYLDLYVNDTVHVLQKGQNEWWDGVVERNGEYLRGWFPSSYCKSITTGLTKNIRKNVFDALMLNQGSSSRRDSGLSAVSSNIDRSSVADSQTEINILTADEVNSLCDRVLLQTNEPPVWVPQLTDEGTLIYYNEKFNAYSRDLPLTSNPTIEPESLLKFPNKAVLNNLDTVSLPKDDEALEKLNYRPVISSSNDLMEARELKESSVKLHLDDSSSTLQSLTGSAYKQELFKSHNASFSGETVHQLNNALFSRDDLFYTDPSDMKTWIQLLKTLYFLVDVTIDALSNNQSSLFSAHFNRLAQLCVLFQLCARLVQHELVQQNLDYLIQRKLKKMTNSVAELGLNGDLHISLVNRGELSGDDVTSNFSESTTSEDVYLENARVNAKLLKARAESCYKIFTKLKYEDPSHDLSLLPQIYPRFLKDVFDGANWTNPLFDKKESPFKYDRKSQPFVGTRPKHLQDRSNRPKILLDKDAISTLEWKKTKLTKILGELIETLQMKPAEGVDLTKFTEEKNIAVLSVVYNILQPASRIMDILEAFDFSVFKAVKQIPTFKNHSLFSDSASSQGDIVTDPVDMESQAGSAFLEQEVVSYTYPMLIEFFEYKQELYDSISELIMDAQGLTLEDPEIFKGIKEDDSETKREFANLAESLAAKLKNLLIENDINSENDARLMFKQEDKLRSSIDKLGKSLGMVLYSAQQLITERENILNYSSRNMNIEFDISIFMGERHSTLPELLDDYNHKEDTTRQRRLSKDVPWYLDIDEAEYSIIYDSKGNVKGGTIDGLISHLTSNGERESDFLSAFLLTFRSFISPIDLITKLEQRYNILPPEGLSFEEYNTWIEKKSKVVRINTMTTIWLLLTRFWNYFYYDEPLMDKMAQFIQNVSDEIVPNKKEYLDKIKSVSEASKRRTNHSVGSSCKIEQIQNTELPPPPVIKGSSLRKLKLKDIDPLEMARQLTIREFAFYSRITELEFLDKIWGDKYSHLGSSTNIKYFISYANKLTNFISFMIIKHKDIKKRAETIVYFIKVCEKCLVLKNYSSLTAIISALSSSPIARLKKTWALVPKSNTETFNRLDKLMSIDRNYNEYRDLLKFVKDNEPCIPFLGIYLTDLTFVSQAISDNIDRDREMINFYKRYKIYHTITECLKYERVPYNFQIVHEIQSFLDSWFSVSPDVNDQHKVSLQLEPRVVPSS